MLQRCQFLFPCYCMRMKKLKEQKSNSRQNADQYFPADCKMRQSKKSCQISCKPEAAEPDGFPVFLFSYFPHSIQKPDRQFCPVRFLSTYVFSSEHTQHSPVFRGQRLNRTSCHPAPELFRSVPAQRSLPEPVSLPVRAAV